MNGQERLRELIDQQQDRLRASVPPDRVAAITTLLDVLDRQPDPSWGEPRPDLIIGRGGRDLGASKALQLCLASSDKDVTANPNAAFDGYGDWAERFREECSQLAEAALVLGHCETGFMRMVHDGSDTFDAWIATKRSPVSWRERTDIDWWAAWLARRYESELRTLQAGRRGDAGDEAYYRRLADVRLRTMGYQFGYPPDAIIGGCPVQTYLDVLRTLIGGALAERDHGERPIPRIERSLVADIAAVLALDPAVVALAVAGFRLDEKNASYHAAVPGVAAAPLVRLGQERIIWSLRGLLTEPLLFLARELRRRDAQAYHNVAFLRETVFRQDLYGLFPDSRFVTSAGRIQLRRERGSIRTDIDAVIFDRKTGALGIFELKSQDPFARSTAELIRQRDNVLYANHQVSGVLDWLKRQGADELLSRVDNRIAKRYRVQKIFPFVLGRYLVHFNDGPAPDRRAAWGTWPQVLRLLDGPPLAGSAANPLASLFTRLTKDAPLIQPPVSERPQTVAIGDARLIVHPSYAAFKASAR